MATGHCSASPTATCIALNIPTRTTQPLQQPFNTARAARCISPSQPDLISEYTATSGSRPAGAWMFVHGEVMWNRKYRFSSIGGGDLRHEYAYPGTWDRILDI